MGFLIRALFVIGVLYLVSPLRAPLPEWLATPSAHGVDAASATALLSTAAKAAVQPASTVSTAVAPAASATVSANVATMAQTAAALCKGHEKTCLDAASSALKSADAGDPLAALMKDALGDLPPVTKPQPLALADAVESPVIPLPPRREPIPAPQTGQKKI
jgi:hypothetical protein